MFGEGKWATGNEQFHHVRIRKTNTPYTVTNLPEKTVTPQKCK